MIDRVQPLIAVVDDEEPVRKALLRLLRSAGLEATAHESGRSLLEACRGRRPDCVVLDYHLPELDGAAVQRLVREAGWDLPIIILTGHDTPETRHQALVHRPHAYLCKPVDDAALLGAIRNALPAGALPGTPDGPPGPGEPHPFPVPVSRIRLSTDTTT